MALQAALKERIKKGCFVDKIAGMKAETISRSLNDPTLRDSLCQIQSAHRKMQCVKEKQSKQLKSLSAKLSQTDVQEEQLPSFSVINKLDGQSFLQPIAERTDIERLKHENAQKANIINHLKQIIRSSDKLKVSAAESTSDQEPEKQHQSCDRDIERLEIANVRLEEENACFQELLQHKEAELSQKQVIIAQHKGVIGEHQAHSKEMNQALCSTEKECQSLRHKIKTMLCHEQRVKQDMVRTQHELLRRKDEFARRTQKLYDALDALNEQRNGELSDWRRLSAEYESERLELRATKEELQTELGEAAQRLCAQQRQMRVVSLELHSVRTRYERDMAQLHALKQEMAGALQSEVTLKDKRMRGEIAELEHGLLHSVDEMHTLKLFNRDLRHTLRKVQREKSVLEQYVLARRQQRRRRDGDDSDADGDGGTCSHFEHTHTV